MRDESFWDRLWFWMTCPFYMLIWIYLCLTIKDHPYLYEIDMGERVGEEEEVI